MDLSEVKNERVVRKVHLAIPTGGICNNRCIFCMEKELEMRRLEVERCAPEEVRRRLEQHQRVAHVVFCTGEPTLNPKLTEYISMARDLEYRSIGVISNGRRLSDPALCEEILDAGANEIIISVHGPSSEVHDALTGQPGSFAETWQGILNVSELRNRRPSIRFALSFSLNRVNTPYLAASLRKFAPLNITSVQLHPLRFEGFALDNADALRISLHEIARVFREAMCGLPDSAAGRICLAGVPLCLMAGMESHWVRSTGVAGARWSVESAELWTADANFIKRPECLACACQPLCPGVDQDSLNVYGWDAFVPVAQFPEHARISVDAEEKPLTEAPALSALERQKLAKDIAALNAEFDASNDLSTGARAECAWKIALLYLRLNARDDAANWLETAVRIEPCFADAHLKLAEIYLGMEQTQKARDALRCAGRQRLTPDNKQLLELLLRSAPLK